MSCEREMTLDEWVGRLLPTHRAVRELAELREALATERAAREAAEAQLPALRSRVEGLRKRVRTLAHQWETHPYMPLDMGTAAAALRELLAEPGREA